MTLEVYEGVIVVVPIVQPTKKRGRMSTVGADMPPQVGELDRPTTSRIDELFVRSSAFLHSESNPWLALLYEDNMQKVRLRIRELDFTAGTSGVSADATFKEVQKLEGGEFGQELDMGSSHLIPIPAPLGGLIVLGETSIKYIDDNANDVITRNLDEATVFVAWEKIDSQRWLLADDYGRLFFLSFILNNQGNIDDWKLDYLGSTTRASVMVYLGNAMLFIGSHQGDSQVIKLNEDGSFKIIQTLSNIAPILDFTIMDLGNRTSDSQAHEFSSGQARIVTGSGAFDDGTLRSLRSGVGMEELGPLCEMEHITDLWGLRTQNDTHVDSSDTLVVAFVDETRMLRFSPDGEIEELDSFPGLTLTESTVLVTRLSGGRILQVTENRVLVADLESGMINFEWEPRTHKLITAASANDDHLVLVVSGQVATSFDLKGDVKFIAEKDFGSSQQISGLTVPSDPSGIFIAAFPQSALVSTLAIDDFAEIDSKSLGPAGESFPRSVLVAQVLEDQSPTVFVSMADGCVITFSLDNQRLGMMTKLVLGSEQPILKLLPNQNGLFNVFATCENPSLIYGSEGRIIYSAVNSEGASRICHLNAEAFPSAIAVATEKELKIAYVDKERTTQIQTLQIGSTVRRVSYSPSEKAFGLGTIERKLKDGEEVVKSHFVLADEILFGRLDAIELRKDELIECVIRAESTIKVGGKLVPKDRFIVGTAFATEEKEDIRGRILVLEVDHGRKLSQVAELPVMGACRALAAMGDYIVAALVKTVVVYKMKIDTVGPMKLEKTAAYRTSTAPVDLTVVGDLIAVADLMKSVCLIKFENGKDGEPDKLTEVGRHYQTVWSTGVAYVGDNTFLQSDAEGNLIVLSRNMNGVTPQDKHRLEPTSEMSLGEMVNRIQPVNIPHISSVMVTPQAFMATVSNPLNELMYNHD
jgi:DNA damage-binding protein 1